MEFTIRDNAIHAFEQQMFQPSHTSAKASLAYIEALRAGQGIQALLEGIVKLKYISQTTIPLSK